MFEIGLEIADNELDSTYRHIHHADIIKYFEKSRVSFLESLGYPIEHFVAQDLFLVISAIAVQYKREVSTGSYRITCENCRVEGKRIVINQRIINGRGKDAVVAEVESQLLSRKVGRAVTLPPAFASSLTQAGAKFID